jgi:hypothetical protein
MNVYSEKAYLPLIRRRARSLGYYLKHEGYPVYVAVEEEDNSGSSYFSRPDSLYLHRKSNNKIK